MSGNVGEDPNSEDVPPIDTNWVLYKNRRDWSGVIPVPQDDGPQPVVAIAYSERCEYFIYRMNFIRYL